MLSTRISPTSTCELTDEELAARSQQGDALALDQLLRRYRRFARSRARSYYLVGADADDIEQEGLIGLYKAARDFRPDRQTSFRGFAEVCVTRQVISAVKAATRHKHRPLNQYVSFSAPRRDDADDRSFEDTLDDRRNLDPADEVISREQIVAIRRSMHESLSGLEVDVLRLYIEGKSYQEIGLYLGRHTKSIDNALQRIKRKLDQHVTETPEDGTPAKLALAS
jgi:RNA polymerase sporulation-specific sigma factor